MGRGLDGYLFTGRIVVPRCGDLCSFEGPPEALVSFRWLWRGGNTSSLSEQSS